MRPAYRNKSQIVVDTVSPNEIISDYLYILTSSRMKASKRIKRLSFICDLLGLNSNKLLNDAHVLKEKPRKMTSRDLYEYFFSETNDDREDGKESDINKEIGDTLTKRLNADDVIYNMTCRYTYELVQQLKNHKIFGSLIANKSIIFLHKGSMAQKRLFKQLYPERSNEIEAVFGTGGDNDCTVLINPSLPNFNKTRYLLIDYIHHFLLQNVDSISEGIVNQYANSIKSIRLYGETLHISPCKRHYFMILDNGDRVTDHHRNKVYVSRNDNLNFLDEANNQAKFSLLRFKKAFKVRYRGISKNIGAEILDISVPDRGDYRLMTEFDKYKIPNNWTTTLNIS